MSLWTDNPVADYDRYCAEQEREMEKYPECCDCGKHIADDFLYFIFGDFYCEECMKDEYRRPTDDFIEED